MTVIYKYAVTVTRKQHIIMPRDAKILSAQCQGDCIQLWARVDPSEPLVNRAINVLGTGHEFFGYPGEFIATVQTGPYVWHLFDGGETA